MRIKRHHFLCLTSSWFFLAACQPTSPQSSSLDHALGHTTRSRAALSPCEWGDAKDPVIGYMKSILQKLVAANATTFQGILDPSHFCLQLDGDAMINGVAYIENGEIHLTKGLLRSVAYDADIAAVLSHELAHISMNHRYDLEHDKVVAGSRVNDLKAELSLKQNEYRAQQADYFTLLATSIRQDMSFFDKLQSLKTAEYLKYTIQLIRKVLDATAPSIQDQAGLLDDLSNIHIQLKDEPDDNALMETNSVWKKILVTLEQSDRDLLSIRDHIAQLNKALREIPRDDLIQDGAGAASNWTEQEADEVGFEFYLRAGFRADRFTHIHNILMVQSRSDKDCETLLSAGQLPTRGKASHPSSCWRIHNIQQRETMAHAQEYKPFMMNTTLNIETNKLNEIQASL